MGHETYLASKDKEDKSMSRTHTAAEHTYEAGMQGPRVMVKARLLQIQFTVVYEFAGQTACVKMTSHLSQAVSLQLVALPQVRTMGNDPMQVNEWMTYNVLHVPKRRNAGLPTGRESYGNGVPIVVRGRENLLHGEGEQETQTLGKGRYS